MGIEKEVKKVSETQITPPPKKSTLYFQLYEENRKERRCFLDAWIMRLIRTFAEEYLQKMS